MLNNPEFYTIEQMKMVGMWPLSYLSGHVMVPYINRMKGTVVGLEVGVLKGETAKVILDACPNIEKYYGVDPYEAYFDVDHQKTQEDMDNFKEVAHENLKEYANFNGYPKYQLVDRVLEELDFILIDGMHTYDQVKYDLSTYYPLLKDGGMIFCHDYNNPEVNRSIKEWRRENKVSQPILVMPNYLWSWVK
jgi:predicted O-methyltransferase YrrM